MIYFTNITILKMISDCHKYICVCEEKRDREKEREKQRKKERVFEKAYLVRSVPTVPT